MHRIIKISFFNFYNYLVDFIFHSLGFLLLFVFLNKILILQNLFFLAFLLDYIIDSALCHLNSILSSSASFLSIFFFFPFCSFPFLLFPFFHILSSILFFSFFFFLSILFLFQFLRHPILLKLFTSTFLVISIKLFHIKLNLMPAYSIKIGLRQP